ncbi:MAG: LysR substrate-binding domain-containing protein, partial [Cypionkella sp.]
MPDDQMQIRGNLDRALASLGLSLHTIALVNNFSAMRALIRAGLGIGILTPAEALAELQSGEFIFIPFLDKAIATSQLSLVTVSHPSVTASRLAERIVSEMNAMLLFGIPQKP